MNMQPEVILGSYPITNTLNMVALEGSSDYCPKCGEKYRAEDTGHYNSVVLSSRVSCHEDFSDRWP